MAQKRIYDLTQDTAPTTDHSIPIDKSGNAAATRVTIANLLQKIRVGVQSYGGNARGTAAVDLQITRTANTQVASGNYATVAGGYGNTASGANDTVGGGYYNTASGTEATVGGGNTNAASQAGSTVAGGNSNVASGVNAIVAGGQGNTASGAAAGVGAGFTNLASGVDAFVGGGYINTVSADYSWTPGGRSALANKYGQGAHAAGYFAAAGDAQHSWLVARRQVTSHTDTTWYTLFLDGASLPITLLPNTLWQFQVMVVGVTAARAQMWAYSITGIIGRDAGGPIGTGLFTSTVTPIYESDAAYDCQVVGDSTNGALGIQVRRNGGTNYNVRWVANVEIVEVTFP